MIRKRVLALAAFSLAAALAPRTAQAATAEGAAAYRVTCSSRDYNRVYCRTDTRGGVQLVRQLSTSPCRRNESWGYDRNAIWVSRGCRAEFLVGGDDRYDDRDRDRDRDGRYDRDDDRYGRGGRYDRAEVVRAERACENAIAGRSNARRRDVSVRYTGVTRTGLSVVRWSTPRNSGTCQVARNGRVVDIDSRNDRGRDRNRW